MDGPGWVLRTLDWCGEPGIGREGMGWVGRVWGVFGRLEMGVEGLR